MNARGRKDRGSLSILFGALSIVTLIAAQQAKLLWDPRLAHFLTWMDSHGLVAPPSKNQPELSPSGLITFTDESVLLLLTGFGICLAVTSIVFSLVAEYRNEENLYLSIGFMLGALGLFLFSLPAGVAAMIMGALAVQVLRRHRRPPARKARPLS